VKLIFDSFLSFRSFLKLEILLASLSRFLKLFSVKKIGYTQAFVKIQRLLGFDKRTQAYQKKTFLFFLFHLTA
jgi:hypothetical protein